MNRKQQLSPTARLMLRLLADSATPLTIPTIAAAVYSSPRTVALLANELTRKGLLRRTLNRHTALFAIAPGSTHPLTQPTLPSSVTVTTTITTTTTETASA